MEVLSFHYHLNIRFDSPIHDHQFTLRCCPVSDSRQRILQEQRFVFPRESLGESRDSFGNLCIYGYVTRPHSSFEADICGEAVTGLAEAVPVGNPYQENLFLYQTDLTRPNDEMVAFCRGIPFQVGERPLAQAQKIMEAVYRHMTYTQNVTDVNTSAAQAFTLGRGVCQDYAHIMISLLRLRGIKARYVVGMLMGEGLSHAWVEAEDNGLWYALDPTNFQMVADQHIKISHGRDYQDCRINQGLFYGPAHQQQEISVIVQRK